MFRHIPFVDRDDERTALLDHMVCDLEVLIKGHKGYVLLTHAGNDAVLTVLCKPNARLGLIFLDVKRAAEGISKVL